MKMPVALLGIGALVALAAPARAERPGDPSRLAIAQAEFGETDPKWWLSAGAFLPTDLPAGVDAETGYSIAVGTILSSRATAGQAVGTLRYSRYRLLSAGDIELIQPMLEYRCRFGPARRLYLGPSIGAVFGTNTRGGHTFSFAYGGAVGYDLPPVFAEVRVIRGTKDAEHGVVLSLGVRL